MVTADSVKAKLQGLIAKANEVTGNTDADLTTAVNALVAGFGQGGGGLPEGIIEYEIQTFTPEKDTNEALTFSLNMEEVPTLISIATDMPNVITRSFVSCDGHRPYEGLEGDSGLAMKVGVRYYTPSIMQDVSVVPTSTTNRSGVWNLTNKGFTFRTNYYGGQHTYFRAGYTYTIIAMRLVTHEISN